MFLRPMDKRVRRGLCDGSIMWNAPVLAHFIYGGILKAYLTPFIWLFKTGALELPITRKEVIHESNFS